MFAQLLVNFHFKNEGFLQYKIKTFFWFRLRESRILINFIIIQAKILQFPYSDIYSKVFFNIYKGFCKHQNFMFTRTHLWNLWSPKSFLINYSSCPFESMLEIYVHPNLPHILYSTKPTNEIHHHPNPS